MDERHKNEKDSIMSWQNWKIMPCWVCLHAVTILKQDTSLYYYNMTSTFTRDFQSKQMATTVVCFLSR